MNCQEAIAFMHEHLDRDLKAESSKKLMDHLQTCSSCKQLFSQLERTEALLRVPQHCTSPPGMKERIMSRLPEPRSKRRSFMWIKRHPFVVLAMAACFIFGMNFVSIFYVDKDMVVQGSLDQLVIVGDTVVVPDGVTVHGNLKVERGKLQIDGNVEGNVTVINGSYNLASSAYISGHITVVDAALDWIWYKLKNMFKIFSRESSMETASFNLSLKGALLLPQ